VSSLDDILEMPPSYFDKIKFESKISSDITQHLKVRQIPQKCFRFGGSLRTRGSLKMSRVAQYSCTTSKTVGFSSRRRRRILFCSFIRPELKV
jgi:hypothetical protein